jgi:hypothetical protein
VPPAAPSPSPRRVGVRPDEIRRVDRAILHATGWRERFLLDYTATHAMTVVATKPMLSSAAVRHGIATRNLYLADGHLDPRGDCAVAHGLAAFLLASESRPVMREADARVDCS